MKKLNLVGTQQGRLYCLEETGKYLRCGCACGAEIVVRRGNFLAGYTKSCGCLRSDRTRAANTTHGKSKTALYAAWKTMLARCYNPSHDKFRYYGGRDIRVCPRWHQFENFLADMGERPAGKELDRINNDGDYEPSNCRWITHKENCNNR